MLVFFNKSFSPPSIQAPAPRVVVLRTVAWLLTVKPVFGVADPTRCDSWRGRSTKSSKRFSPIFLNLLGNGGTSSKNLTHMVVKNDDESYGIRIRRKSPEKQIHMLYPTSFRGQRAYFQHFLLFVLRHAIRLLG